VFGCTVVTRQCLFPIKIACFVVVGAHHYFIPLLHNTYPLSVPFCWDRSHIRPSQKHSKQRLSLCRLVRQLLAPIANIVYTTTIPIKSMQFSYNSDYPGLTEASVNGGDGGGGPTIPALAISREPLQFPPAQPIPCAKITTRVFHPSRNQVATVQNVLVRIMNSPPSGGEATSMLMMMAGSGGGTNAGSGGGGADGLDNPVNDGDANSLSSGMSSTSSSDDDSMNIDDNNGGGHRGQQQQQGGMSSSSDLNGPLSGRTVGGSTSSNNNENDEVVGPNETKCAYWIQRTIREAIYGRVLFAVILKRRPRSLVARDGAEWEVTTEHCAVKEMSWQHIRRERDRLAEDPIKEVSSMQYLQKWYQEQRRQNKILQLQQQQQQQQRIFQQQQQQQLLLLQQQQQQQLLLSLSTPPITTTTIEVDDYGGGDGDVVAQSFMAMKETNIMMPLDLLSDERNLYSIMPYCDGGELFERLDLNERFSEDEARYWMDQVLNVRVPLSIVDVFWSPFVVLCVRVCVHVCVYACVGYRMNI
jgi:hypothetical protein